MNTSKYDIKRRNKAIEYEMEAAELTEKLSEAQLRIKSL